MTDRNGSRRAKLPQPVTTSFVPCQGEPGMFHDEYLVYLDVVQPDDPGKKVRAQLLVDQREVKDISGQPERDHPASAWLRVSLIGKKKGFAQLVLPQPANPIGENILMEESAVKLGSDE